ncbi:hypothetical protein CGCF415_v010534 [Colletotrichum fructicola]|uniref:Tautomerase cis-CaaD-like domain-containing protein n=1 Tax=Colletotrichum fructicola (strain Nara gc5) TaxID=1213859 RepID=L2FFU4_COLFN|nr:uncharacterized protein CGMCC3_g14766 [Colletotrichum fructicola]KAF4475597.1 hypothetical protein CGGC5_v016144 [Colletotrichum fructicola Nara gc5]KAE9569102.1 hypothetical protein CGMCC3_g14766 [Colletotrichum fructicola]KAF4421044.1 hypothetical protein CFRS1_v005311 [Colletotrichum fructicola]KAF4884018.1 hypothetical protein CGCFRS4_v013035 [Colletotrichum fructicola]KAF4899292.1 hypothetical protein CGCF415_v010534 [Colletotrichum fructicola]
MPLWLIYHPPNVFIDDETKRALSKDITSFYTSFGLPAFYVVVNFIKLQPNDIWVGGKPRTSDTFIRITVDHIAVTLPNNDESYKRSTDGLHQILKPHIEDKGYDWEFHINETERRLWMINGMYPPQWKSEGEKLWFEENRPVALDPSK